MSSNKRFLVERFRVRCFVECIDRSKYSSGSNMNTVIYLSYPHTASYFASRFDRWTNVSIQRIRCSRHENFSTYLWKKKTKKEKEEEKQVLKVYEKYQATSELWSWENALVHQPLFFSPLSILYEIYGSGISKDWNFLSN